jgi:putative MATE family efflux protein
MQEGVKKAVLVEGPVGRMLINLTAPMIMGIVSIVAFNLVDTFFVGRLGTLELAALSYTFPVVLVLGSLAIGLGTGASAVISRAIGEGNEHKVKRLTTDSLILSVLIVAGFAVLGLLTIDRVFTMLGAPPDILPLIREYMRIWYIGSICVVVPMVGNSAIRAAGDTRTPGIIMMIAAAVNCIFDPLLIFGIGPFPRLEIAGAAIATVIARTTTLIVSLLVLTLREKMITLQIPSFNTFLSSLKRILFIGLPAAGTRIIIPIATGVITRLLSSYGPEVVAGYGVSSRIEFFSMTIVLALSTVLGPFIGQNWGAGKIDRVKMGIRYSEKFAMVWGVILFAVLALTARPFARIFNENPTVISTIVVYLRIVPLGFGLQGVLLVCVSAMNVLNKPLHAAAISILQMFALYIPLAYLMSQLFEVQGVYISLALAYGIVGVAGHYVLKRILVKNEGSRN